MNLAWARASSKAGSFRASKSFQASSPGLAGPGCDLRPGCDLPAAGEAGGGRREAEACFYLDSISSA